MSMEKWHIYKWKHNTNDIYTNRNTKANDIYTNELKIVYKTIGLRVLKTLKRKYLQQNVKEIWFPLRTTYNNSRLLTIFRLIKKQKKKTS